MPPHFTVAMKESLVAQSSNCTSVKHGETTRKKKSHNSVWTQKRNLLSSRLTKVYLAHRLSSWEYIRGFPENPNTMNKNSEPVLAPKPMSLAMRSFMLITTALVGLMMISCMSLSFGGRTYEAPEAECGSSPACGCKQVDGVLVQKGQINLRGQLSPEVVQTVYYPVPYASPPNLQVGGDGFLDEAIVLVEQHPDHFKYRTSGSHVFGGSIPIRWTARGVRRADTIPPPSRVPLMPPGSVPGSIPSVPLEVEIRTQK